MDNKSEQIIRLTTERPYIAVASLRGLFVNLKLCESEILRIYKPNPTTVDLIDMRRIPGEEIRGIARWKQLAELLNDCCCLLVHGIERAPYSILTNSGICVLVVEGFVDKAITRIGAGKSILYMTLEKQMRITSLNQTQNKCE